MILFLVIILIHPSIFFSSSDSDSDHSRFYSSSYFYSSFSFSSYHSYHSYSSLSSSDYYDCSDHDYNYQSLAAV
jgi:hypothetical protein